MAPAMTGLAIKPIVSITAKVPRIAPKWANPKARGRSNGSSNGPPPLPTIQKTRKTAMPAVPESSRSAVIAAIRKATSTTAAFSMRGIRSASAPKTSRERMPKPAAPDTSAAATPREMPTDS